jgi:transcriptional regulator with XRE-family HTH domain
LIVREKIVLSPEFRAWLRSLMTQKGFSVNALALAADLHQSTFNSGLLGNRNIPNEVLRVIAPHLGLDPENLIVRADVDRIGGIERIRKHAPELLAPIEAPRSIAEAAKRGERDDRPAKVSELREAISAWPSGRTPTTPPKGMPDLKKVKMRSVERAAGEHVDQGDDLEWSE